MNQSTNNPQSGLTLIEVMVAVAILAGAVLLLLERRIEIVRNTSKIRESRTAWSLLARKMAELELDPELFQGEGDTGSGDFSDIGDEYADYLFEYELVMEFVETNDPENPEEEPSEIFRLTLILTWVVDGQEKTTSLSGYFPVPEESTP